jgi:hypothetical protein
MAEDGSTVGKVADKLAGALEKMVDVQMLVLGISFLLYTDAWLIFTNTNITNANFEDGLNILRHLTIHRLVIFLATYSMFMTLVIPVFRYVWNYARFLVSAQNGPDEPRALQAKRLSDWSAAVLALTGWSGLVGYFKMPGEYRGLVIYTFNGLGGNDFTTVVFRLAACFFLWFCFMNAFERDF